jgi:hypothetical protein
MTDDEGIAYFDGADDARVYLREVAVLWSSWLVALACLVVVQELWLLIVVAVLTLGALLFFARPLQQRASRLVPLDKAVMSKKGRPVGTMRDRTLKALAYGDGPLRAATDLVGGQRMWLLGRRLLLGVSGAALVWVLVSPG